MKTATRLKRLEVKSCRSKPKSLVSHPSHIHPYHVHLICSCQSDINHHISHLPLGIVTYLAGHIALAGCTIGDIYYYIKGAKKDTHWSYSSGTLTKPPPAAPGSVIDCLIDHHKEDKEDGRLGISCPYSKLLCPITLDYLLYLVLRYYYDNNSSGICQSGSLPPHHATDPAQRHPIQTRNMQLLGNGRQLLSRGHYHGTLHKHDLTGHQARAGSM